MRQLLQTAGAIGFSLLVLFAGHQGAVGQPDYELELIKTFQEDTLWVDVILKQTGAPEISGTSGVLLSATIDLLYDPSIWVYGYQVLPGDTSVIYNTFPRQFNAFGGTVSYGKDVGLCGADCPNPNLPTTTNTVPSRGNPEPEAPFVPDVCDPPDGTCTSPTSRTTIVTATNITNPLIVTESGLTIASHAFTQTSPVVAEASEVTVSKSSAANAVEILPDSSSLIICYGSSLTGPTFSCCTGDGDDPTGEGETGIGFCTIDDQGGEPQLPVELSSFTATNDAGAIVLQWQTASEENNAGFSIEHARHDSEEFAELAFVEGHGTTTEPQEYTYTTTGLDIGRHRFRLKQVDFDGAFEYSEVVETLIELAGTHRLGAAYPNPFNPSTTFELIVGKNQVVQIDVINALGQRVQRLFDGLLEANEPRNFVFDARTLPSGLYFYRVAGENFAETKQMLLVK